MTVKKSDIRVKSLKKRSMDFSLGYFSMKGLRPEAWGMESRQALLPEDMLP